MRISDWSSDVCSSDLRHRPGGRVRAVACMDGESFQFHGALLVIVRRGQRPESMKLNAWTVNAPGQALSSERRVRPEKRNHQRSHDPLPQDQWYAQLDEVEQEIGTGVVQEGVGWIAERRGEIGDGGD